MTGWLIYDPKGAERNAWFAAALIQAAKKNGMELQLKISPDLDRLDGSPDRPDFAVVRAICPDYNRHLEAMGIPVFNNAATAAAANDKWKTYQLCRSLHIPVLPTAPAENSALFRRELGYPFAAKSRDGHGGSEVFCIQNEDQWNTLAGAVNLSRFIVQQFCTDPGKDMRVYALGDRIPAGMIRTSETDFRSNYSLGGRAEQGDVTENQRAVVRKLKEALNFDFIGADFIVQNGRWMLNEIEDPVGTRMLYAMTDLDPAAMMMDYIAGRLKK